MEHQTNQPQKGRYSAAQIACFIVNFFTKDPDYKLNQTIVQCLTYLVQVYYLGVYNDRLIKGEFYATKYGVFNVDIDNAFSTRKKGKPLSYVKRYIVFDKDGEPTSVAYNEFDISATDQDNIKYVLSCLATYRKTAHLVAKVKKDLAYQHSLEKVNKNVKKVAIVESYMRKAYRDQYQALFNQRVDYEDPLEDYSVDEEEESQWYYKQTNLDTLREQRLS